MALVKAPASPPNPTKAPTSDVPREILRDGYKRPLIQAPDGDVRPMTRASSLGSVLEDQTGLGVWRMRQVAWGVANSRAIRMRAQAITTTTELDDKRELGRVAWDAFDYADSNEAAQVGTALHAISEKLDRGEPLPDLDDDERPAMAAYTNMIQHFTVHAIETFVVCPELDAAGTFDRLLSPKVELVVPELDLTISPEDRVIDDLKTSSTSTYFGLKFAVQELIYSHGTPYRGWVDRVELERLGYDREMSLDDMQRLPLKVKVAITRGEYLSWPDGIAPRRDVGLIMHVPSGGSTADLHAVDLVQGLELARLAKIVQDRRKLKGLVIPLDPPRIPLDGALSAAGLMSMIAAMPAGPDLRDRLLKLWSQHAKVWTPAHTAEVEARLATPVGSRLGRA
jgi:hypothetical protein